MEISYLHVVNLLDDIPGTEALTVGITAFPDDADAGAPVAGWNDGNLQLWIAHDAVVTMVVGMEQQLFTEGIDHHHTVSQQ